MWSAANAAVVNVLWYVANAAAGSGGWWTAAKAGAVFGIILLGVRVGITHFAMGDDDFVSKFRALGVELADAAVNLSLGIALTVLALHATMDDMVYQVFWTAGTWFSWLFAYGVNRPKEPKTTKTRFLVVGGIGLACYVVQIARILFLV